MILDLKRYRSLVFDCDGVLLNSNETKSRAFHVVTERFGTQLADRFLAYHQAHGGVSRYVKFRYFVEEILGMPGHDGLVDVLLEDYAREIKTGLLTCDEAPGLLALREYTAAAIWSVASGGDEAELRDVFRARRLAALFDGGIYGSPTEKSDILRGLFADGRLRRPALFLGDSQYDHECAVANDLDFVFVSGWTEFGAWQRYCADHGVDAVDSPSLLLGAECEWPVTK